MSSNQKKPMPADADLQQFQNASSIRAEVTVPAKYPGETPSEKLVLHEFFLIPNMWQDFRIQVSDPGLIRERGVEIHPVCESGLISISNIRFIDETDGTVLWSAHHDFSRCLVYGDAQAIYHEAGLQLICCGKESRLQLPALAELPDISMIMEIWIRPDLDFMGLARNCRTLNLRLAQEANRNKELMAQVHDLEQQVQMNQEQISELRKSSSNQVHKLKHELQAQRTLTSRYFNELASAEQLLEDQQALSTKNTTLTRRNKILSRRNKMLYQGLIRLNKDLHALLSSARWKTGNTLIRFLEVLFFRKKQPLAVDNMRQTILELKQKHKGFDQSDDKRKTVGSTDRTKDLQDLIRLLHKDFQSIKSSFRWRVGNFLVRGCEMLIFRSRQSTSVDRLQHHFQNIRPAWQDGQGIETEMLEKNLAKINNEFMNIRHSNRWIVGNSIFSFVDILLLRKGKPTAMDHALKLLARYNNECQ